MEQIGPHFICLGAQKAATAWIYDQFKQHSGFWAPPIKELTFFDKGVSRANRERAERRLAWRLKKRAAGAAEHDPAIAFLETYLTLGNRRDAADFQRYFKLFADKPGRSFDCTPGYSRLGRPDISRMVAALPDTRFFLILRDPAERLWSHAQMHYRLGREDFDPVGTLEGFQRFAARAGVQRFSFLAANAAVWQELADPARFRLFSFDALGRDAAAFRDVICDFLDADPDGFSVPPEENRKSDRAKQGALPPEYRQWLAGHFAREYQALAQLGLPDAVDWAARNAALLPK